MEQKFKASLNSASWVITTFVIGFTVALTMFLISKFENYEVPGWIVWAFPMVMGSICVGLLLYRPVVYILTPYSLVVHRWAGDLVIDLKQIELVRTVSKEEMGLPIRTFGNGGIFGFTGSYFSSQVGKMRWYATRTEGYILVRLVDGRQLILTPDDPMGFSKKWGEYNSVTG